MSLSQYPALALGTFLGYMVSSKARFGLFSLIGNQLQAIAVIACIVLVEVFLAQTFVCGTLNYFIGGYLLAKIKPKATFMSELDSLYDYKLI